VRRLARSPRVPARLDGIGVKRYDFAVPADGSQDLRADAAFQPEAHGRKGVQLAIGLIIIAGGLIALASVSFKQNLSIISVGEYLDRQGNLPRRDIG